jgi:pyruvyltransferase
MLLFNQSAYAVSESLVLSNGKVPLTWWCVMPNFGDLLAPYLIKKLTTKPVTLVDRKPGRSRDLRLLFGEQPFSYLSIGSIISRANSNSIVWGSGAFGTERKSDLNKHATYRAVRGPLTRNLLKIQGIECPEVYGDPALLIPTVFPGNGEKKYKVGIILRWSENDWHSIEAGEGVKKINLGTDDVENTLKDIIACERIVSSSLHGLILADAYGIPSAWLDSTTPKGLAFKFYDYFLSVKKIQKPQQFNFNVKRIEIQDLESQLEFNGELIDFDMTPLLQACPFISLKS